MNTSGLVIHFLQPSARGYLRKSPCDTPYVCVRIGWMIDSSCFPPDLVRSRRKLLLLLRHTKIKSYTSSVWSVTQLGSASDKPTTTSTKIALTTLTHHHSGEQSDRLHIPWPPFRLLLRARWLEFPRKYRVAHHYSVHDFDIFFIFHANVLQLQLKALSWSCSTHYTHFITTSQQRNPSNTKPVCRQ